MSATAGGGTVAGREIGFVDTTVRDGQQSLWAMNMRTAHMNHVLPAIDAAGFDAIEVMAVGAAFRKLVRHLGENPWDWLRSAAALAPRTPLRWHGSFEGNTMNGVIPREVGRLFVEKLVDLGLRSTRLGDNWNRMDVVGDKKARLEALGTTTIVHVIYTVSPRHTDEYFVDKARQAGALRPSRLCLKDVGGLLTPERARELLPQLVAATPGIPWEFHGHCNNGFGPVNALEAVHAGFDFVHTAVPPLANGNSQPSVFTTADNLRLLGHTVPIDDEALRPAAQGLAEIARREGFPLGVPHEYQLRQYTHQVPGGMISNLEYQLDLAGVRDRLPETLEEIGRVRAEFGYPIMVTPLSQIVGSQAAINVIVGERYRQVSDETITYALGGHGGEEAIQAMDPEVRALILERPRARELSQRRAEEPTLAEFRRRYGPGICDEDLILRAIVGDDAVALVGGANESRRHTPVTEPPLLRLVRETTARSRHRYVSIERDGFTVRLARRDEEDGDAGTRSE